MITKYELNIEYLKNLIATEVASSLNGASLQEIRAITEKKETLLSQIREVIMRHRTGHFSVLRLISEEKLTSELNGKKLVIPACDGTRKICDEHSLFSYDIDPDFRNLKTDSEKPTGETPVSIYSLEEKSTFSEMFTALQRNLNDLSLTEHQIISFVENFPDCTKSVYAAFFLLKRRGELAVVHIQNKKEKGILVLNQFYYYHGKICPGPFQYRIIVPAAP